MPNMSHENVLRSEETGDKIICAACGKQLEENKPYASLGGNIEPYIPANLYHIRCIPTVKPVYETEQKCYAVVFMNYHPLEVDSLWETREGAQSHIQELTNPSDWDVCEMEIRKGSGS